MFSCDGVITIDQMLMVNQDLTLDASGHKVVISGNHLVRMFKVEPGRTLTLKNLALANGTYWGTNGLNGRNASSQGPALPVTSGETAAGGAIFNDGGILNLFNCIISNNAVIGGAGGSNATGAPEGKGGDAQGGAVFVRTGIVNSVDTRFLNNSAFGGRSGLQGLGLGTLPGHSWGGAIFNSGGTLNLTNTIFISNLSTGVQSYSTTGSLGPDGRAGNAHGGMMYSEGGLINLVSCLLSNNTANGGDALANGGFSGTGRGGALSLTNASIFCSGCVFEQNLASGGQGHFRYSSPGDGSGGAIYNAGSAIIETTTFKQNVAKTGVAATMGGTGKGGAICNLSSLICNQSLYSENEVFGGPAYPVSFVRSVAGDGLGGALYNSGFLSLTNSTFFKNLAQGGTGERGNPGPGTQGLGAGGAVFNAGGTAALVNATLANNIVAGGKLYAVSGPAQGGGIFATNGTVTLQDTIVSYSVGGSNLFGTIIDGGYNLSSDDSFGFSSPNSLNSTDPLLGPLQNNGGLTLTAALTDCSPAVDAGHPTSLTSADQRGVLRPVNGRSDIGAFEGIVTWYHAVFSITGQTMNMKIVGQPNQSFLLKQSTDLATWTSVLTNNIGNNCIYNHSAPTVTYSFYQINYY